MLDSLIIQVYTYIRNRDTAQRTKRRKVDTMANWMKEEVITWKIHGKVFAYDNYTLESMGAFDSYEDFRKAWGGTEITMVVDLGYGVAVYCE